MTLCLVCTTKPVPGDESDGGDEPGVADDAVRVGRIVGDERAARGLREDGHTVSERDQFAGEAVDWETDYSVPLRKGIDTFRCYVDYWYEGGFQNIIFHPDASRGVREMICSILAGYAWDSGNPYVAEPQRRLRSLVEICSA